MWASVAKIFPTGQAVTKLETRSNPLTEPGMWETHDSATPAPAATKLRRTLSTVRAVARLQSMQRKTSSMSQILNPMTAEIGDDNDRQQIQYGQILNSEKAEIEEFDALQQIPTCVQSEVCFQLAEIPSAPNSPELEATEPEMKTFAELVSEGKESYSTKPAGTHDEDGPVDVFVTCLIKDIGDVDIVNGTFFLSIGMKVFWRDPRLINWKGPLPPDLWCPNVMLPNSNDISENSLYHHQASDGVVVQHPASGLLAFHRNTLGHFCSPFDLKAFPFDENACRVRFNGSKLRDGTASTADDIVLWAGTCEGEGMRKGPFVLVAENVQEHMPEFEIVGLFHDSYVQGGCSFITWGVSVRRFANFYMFKMIIFLWIALPMSCTVFMLPTWDLYTRVDILFDCLAVLLAFLFVINDKLPRTPFLHKLDWLILMSLLFTFVTTACSWTANWIYTEYSEDDANLFNKISAAVVVFGWVAINIKLFAVQYTKYLLDHGQTRPEYLKDSRATWIPFEKVVKIDLWAQPKQK